MRDYFQSVERDLFGAAPRQSIPIKGNSFRATELSPSRSGVRDVTSRDATALLIAVKAAGCGLEPGRVAPRSFSLLDDDWIIENGCGQDIIRSGLADLRDGEVPRDGKFVLSARFVGWLETKVGRRRLDEFLNAPASALGQH